VGNLLTKTNLIHTIPFSRIHGEAVENRLVTACLNREDNGLDYLALTLMRSGLHSLKAAESIK
jgi:hypothetical protein